MTNSKNKYYLYIIYASIFMLSGCSNNHSNCQPHDVKCVDDHTAATCQSSGEWLEETCKNGCENGKCKDPSNVCNPNATQCNEAADAVMICNVNGLWENKETCKNGCENGKCKDQNNGCSQNETQCNEAADTVMICNANGLWENKETCKNGCENGKCKDQNNGCSQNETQCNEAADTVMICNANGLWENKEICENGCENGKCKTCAQEGAKRCNADGNVELCQADFTYVQSEVCDFHCNEGACVECATDADCLAYGGVTEGSCQQGKCKADACQNGYIHQFDLCTYKMPFAGNVFVTELDGDLVYDAPGIIGEMDGTIKTWDDPKTTLSLYFAPQKTGYLHLALDAKLADGAQKSTIALTYKGVTHSITVDSRDLKTYDVGEWKIADPGYVKIDIQGTSVSPEGANFADIQNFYIAGDVADGTPICTTTEKLGDVYWHRRGPSVHLRYDLPDTTEWFYNEARVPETSNVRGSYFMLTGFSEGYMGIQIVEDGTHKVLFSVWSPYDTNDPSQIPEDYQVTTIRKGEGVNPNKFGNEGCGMQSFLTWPWEFGKTYRTLVHVKPNEDGTTDYTGYFGDEDGTWHLLASFRRPRTSTWYRGAHSFLESFLPETSIHTRDVHFTNQWARSQDGKWTEITTGTFTFDSTGMNKMRTDLKGYVNGNEFVLQNCGFFSETTPYDTQLVRESSGAPAPNIDFDALEAL